MNLPAKLVLGVAAAIIGAGVAMPAAAQFAKPEDAIKYRKAAMTVMGTHFGRVAAMANGRIPFDAKAAADNAELATMLRAINARIRPVRMYDFLTSDRVHLTIDQHLGIVEVRGASAAAWGADVRRPAGSH